MSELKAGNKETSKVTPAVRNGGWYFKAKKFVVSKLSYTSGGRFVMSKALGAQERKIVDLIFSLVTKFSGKSTSDLLRKYFFNIMGKLYLIYEQGTVLLEESLAPLKEPNYLFASYFLEQLTIPDVGARNIPALQLLLAEATSRMIGLLPLLFKEETVNKSIRIIEYFLDSKFLEFVMKDPQNDAERDLLNVAVSYILNGSTQSPDGHRVHSSVVLRNRLRSRKREIQDLVTNPTLINFLRSEEGSVLIWDWAIESGNKEILNRLSFHTAVEEFKSLANRSLLPSRAQVIAEKYINPSSTCQLMLTESTTAEVQQLIREEKITRALFAPAQREAILLVNQLFEANFVSSEYFGRLQVEMNAISSRISFLFEPVSCSTDDGVDVGVVTADDDSGEIGEGGATSRLSVLWK